MSQANCSAGATLWQKALNELGPDSRASLEGIINDPSTDVVTDVLQEAKKKKALCLRKRWKIEFRGETIVLRDLFDKIIAWADQFKALIDVVVQYDPTAASLPWAGVRFLLHVAISDRQCFESTVCGLEFVSLLIARYAGLEALYLQKAPQKSSSPVKSQLENGLIRVYSDILVFLADGIRYFGQPTPVRMVKSIFRSYQDDRIDRMVKGDEEVIKLAQVVDSQLLRQTSVQVSDIRSIVETLQRPIQRLVDESAIYAKTLEQDKFFKILQWLSSVPYSQHHKRHSDESLAGLSQWIFRHPQYMTWKGSSSSSIMLLHGIPGSGKTHIVTAIIENLFAERSLNPLCAPIAYFYCGDSRFGREWTDPDELMRSITRQFAIFDKEKLKIHESVSLEYARREAEAKLDGFEVPKLRSAECADLILGILGANPAVIIIDGVDEIREDQRHDLLHALTRIRDESASVVKIFLSSRDNNNIFSGLPDASKVRVQETDSRQDMEKYVRHCVSTAIASRNLLNGCVPDDLELQLTEFLIKKAGEMFLWVNLQMERFCKLRSAKSVGDKIQDPSQNSTTIDNLYSGILENLEQTDPVAYETATNTFSWMLCMQEPLTCTAILEAVSSGGPNKHDLNLSELLHICSNLIVLDSQLNTLRFAHVSFKEFLETKPRFDSTIVHGIAALRCLESCINCLPIDVDCVPQPANSYILYAVMYWPNHYVRSIQPHDDLSKKLKEFIFGDEGFPFGLWSEAANEVAKRIPNGHSLKKDLNSVASDTQTPFFTVCIYGLMGIFHEVTGASDFDIDSTNLLGQTGLYLAAACGHRELVSLIMDLGGNPSISKGKHKDPLLAACANGHFSVVEFLVAQEGRSILLIDLESALRVSFPTGNEQITKLLLNTYLNLGENQDSTDRSWILEAAAQTGFVEVMEILTKDSSKSTASKSSLKIINFALRKGNIPFIKRYLEKQQLPEDALATAALFGHTEVINMCIDTGCSIEAENSFGTPLRCASLMGHEAAVRTLLSHGADVNASKSLGDALQTAAMKGHLSITNLLIQHGSRLDNSGGFFGNALQAAAYRGHRDVAETLLNAGALIDVPYSKNGRYKDAFHAAAESGKDKVIDLFISKGYHLPGRDTLHAHYLEDLGGPFKDLLEEASPTRNRLAREFAKESDEESNYETKCMPLIAHVADFQDILHFSTNSVVTPVDETHPVYSVNRSQRHGGDLDSSYYALEVAASRGYLATAQRILAMREQLGLRPYHLGRALWAASKHGDPDLVQAIVSVEVDFCPFISGSLERAARHGHLEAIEILLRYDKSRRLLGKRAAEPSSASVWWCREDLEENQARRRHEYPDYSFGSENVLCLVFPSCRGDQLSTMLRGFQLADESETEDLTKMALREAIRFNSMSIVDFLLKSEVHLTAKFLSQLMKTAAANGCTPALTLLVGRDPTGEVLAANNDVCITSAICGSHSDTVQFLIDNGTYGCATSILEKGFVHAAQMGDIGILKSLSSVMLDSQSYCNILAQSLNAACWAGRRNTAEWLIHAGAEVNSVVDGIPSLETPTKGCRRRQRQVSRGNKWTWPRKPLISCLQPLDRRLVNFNLERDEWENLETARSDRESIIGLLLDHGANVNQVGGCMRTALHIAVEHCSEQVVRALISHGADVNNNIMWHGSPLQCAVRRETSPLPLVSALIEAGAIINFQDNVERYCVVLDESLKHFGPREGGDYGFAELKSMDQVFSDGPGAVIKRLLVSETELRAIDYRFSHLLQMLAARGDLEFIRLLIERGVDVNACGYYYGCALQAAARYSHLECVQLLLEAGSKVNTIEGEYNTPLQAAIVGGHEGVIRELILRGADVNLTFKRRFKDTPKSSPLQLSVRSRNQAVTRLLLENGADPNKGPKVLHLAVDSQDLETVRMLLDAGADVNFQDQIVPSSLITACGLGNMKIATLLIERGANMQAEGIKVDEYGWRGNTTSPNNHQASALHAACAGGNYEIARMLLLHDTNPNQSFGGCATPIAVAASNGCSRTVELLLEFGAMVYDPPDVPNALIEAVTGKNPREIIGLLLRQLLNSPALIPACEEALQEVLAHGSESILLFLIQKVPESLRAFAVACRFGSKRAVSVILSHGVDVNSDLGSGDQALHLAAFHHQIDVVSFLIEKGADASITGSTYGSPISAVLEGLLAVVRSHDSAKDQILPKSTWERSPLPEEIALCKGIVRILREAGADINSTNRPLGPPLHIAAFIGETSLVEFLIDQGASIDATAGHFGSALIAAMIDDRHAALDFLLLRGINVNACSEEFGTALHYACRYKNSKTVQTLLNHGSDPTLDVPWLESPLTAVLNRVTEEDSDGVLKMLLQYAPGLQIRDADLVLAAQVPSDHLCSSKKTALERLLEHSPELPVTQGVIAAIVPLDYPRDKVLKTVLQRANGVEITTDILKSVRKLQTLEVLFQFQPQCEISPEVFAAFARVDREGPYLLKASLDRYPQATLTPGTVLSFLEQCEGYRRCNSSLVDILQTMLDRAPDMAITDNMLMAVAYPDQLRLLLSIYRNNLVADNVLASVFSDSYKKDGVQLLKVFFNHFPIVKIGQETFYACLKERAIDALELLFEQDPSFSLPRDLPSILIAELRTGDRTRELSVFAEVFHRYGKSVEFTHENRRDIDELLQLQSENDLKRLLLTLERKHCGEI